LKPAALAAFAAASTLAGCSSDSSSDWSEYYGLARGLVGSSPAVTLQQAAAIPNASMGVRIGDGPEAIVVLATDSSGDRLWTSVEKVAIYTRNGRIVRTGGLPRNVNTTIMLPDDPLDRLAQGRRLLPTSTKLVDFVDLGAMSVSLACETVSLGRDDIVILGATVKTARIEQKCSAPTLNWSFTDVFWMGSDGLIWRSVQHIHPDSAPIEMEILRPPE
jgi:hypothetical protein